MTDQPHEPTPSEGTELVAEAAHGSDEPGQQPVPSARKDRRILRAVSRWVAVVAVFAGVGAGTAYGVLGAERTELPGLATESDGRWPYPEISRAPVPSGSRGPLDTKNWAEAHYADLRALVLPAPEGATEDRALRGEDGWLATKGFLAVFGEKEDRDEAGQLLTDHGLRHIAARGWTTEDGTRTGIYLLQFDTGAVADEVYGNFTEYDEPAFAARGTTDTDFDDAYPIAAGIEDISRYAYDEVKPYGAEHVRQAYLRAGDVIAVVVQSRKGAAAAVPFQQTVTLQSQLLG
ncbi:hypothetical protein [Streptomyces sp. GESEQ-35]|uniref:hypothetical protein n=1 Tax=Streptomyces sp. GESEQ-35 TaxID=2812657 RepID=UPI001B32EB83|nr:hypothetical protein [Streptomyces sp. GESEQ-35]